MARIACRKRVSTNVNDEVKVHVDNEFHILSYLGEDLPGASQATPMELEDVPGYLLDRVLNTHGKVKAVKFDKVTRQSKFSLAGVQMKFSMKEMDGRYNLSKGEVLGDWIIKTPSTKHKFVPLNEYTAMSLAELVGVDIPEIKLVELHKLDNLPPINLPDERLAFAIKRFDRTRIDQNKDQRIGISFIQTLKLIRVISQLSRAGDGKGVNCGQFFKKLQPEPQFSQDQLMGFPTTHCYISRFCTASAFLSINSRRGSTWSPISVVNS